MKRPDETELQYNELAFYTLAHQDASFIHQHIVDAYTAQIANDNSKSITITFALVGLYLYLEKNYSGRQVQQFHIKMAKNKREWPKFILPVTRGNINIADVLTAPPGPERDSMIQKWCKSVWEVYKNNHDLIIDLTEEYL
jgi:hypothetical protein